jgi:osmotically-inducible protein OsmY
MDSRIVSAAKKSHVFQTHLKDEKVMVLSRQGQVTLTGTVSNEYQRTLAEETVAGLPGVKGVTNQLKVQEEPSGDSPDARLRAKVQAALLFHRDVSATRTRVLVQDGTVTLQGEADNPAQKNLTAAVAKDVDGVVHVVNQMTVAKDPHKRQKEIKRKIDDASITAQLKMALLFNRGTSALATKVTTHAGVVTLSGKAQTQAEKELASRIAQGIDGVKQVQNRMQVGD